MISVIIPVYIREKDVDKSLFGKNRLDVFDICLASLVNQSYKDFEVVVVDDESEIDLKQITDKYKDKFNRFIYHRIPHSGANKARNTGFEISSGRYVIFLDADIKMRSDMLEKLYQALDNNSQVSYAYSRFIYGFKKFKVGRFDEERLKRMPYIHTSSLIRREHFPGFDENIKRLQDWDLYLTMLERGYKGVFIPEYLFKIYTQGSMSQWIPAVFYKKPFNMFLPKFIKQKQDKYHQAMEIIKSKHRL